MRHLFRKVVYAAAAIFAVFAVSCDYSVIPSGTDTAVHPKGFHPLFPQYGPSDGQIATGVIPDKPPEQPIQFTHYRHVTMLGMDCQYCHTEARRSIHAGVPPVEVCMGCHKHVKTDKPEIKKLASYWDKREPIPWKKVHDLPDYVYFSHERHVRAGVDCTECHGLIPLEGKWPDGDASKAEVMKRATPLQMGWCLQCHATHPSIDNNYGDDADLRRAELKDCFTCHK